MTRPPYTHAARRFAHVLLAGNSIGDAGAQAIGKALEQLRDRFEPQQTFDAFEWGGCGCAVDA